MSPDPITPMDDDEYEAQQERLMDWNVDALAPTGVDDPTDVARALTDAGKEVAPAGSLARLDAAEAEVAIRRKMSVAAITAALASPEGVVTLDGERVPEGWRVEWRRQSVWRPLEPSGPRFVTQDIPYLVPYRPEDTKGGDDE